MDRSKQNRGWCACHLLPIGTRIFLLQRQKFLLPRRADSRFARDQAQLHLRDVPYGNRWQAFTWVVQQAQTLFGENISERGHKLVKEVTRKFRREQCLNPEPEARLSLRATGYFFDQLNPYLSEWRAFSRKRFGLVFHRELRDQRGQTLVELMIAMSVMSIGFLGVFAVLSQSLGLNRVVANQYIASNLAAEGIEVVKNIADSNVVRGDEWNKGLSNDKFGVQYDTETLEDVNKDWANRKLPLNFNPDTGIYSYDGRTPTNFVRTITINNISLNEIQVESEVRWRDRGGTEFEVVLEDRFFNWRSP